MMLHTKYQGSRPCGLILEDYFTFSLYKPMLNMQPPGQDHFWPKGYSLNKLGRGPLGDSK